MYRIIASLFATMILSAILTPFIRLLAFKVGAVDNPNCLLYTSDAADEL